MFENEVSQWQVQYLPIDVHDKIVLDVGAGEGETAKFFIDHGAKHVIAVEADPACFENLKKNSQKHPITPLCVAFMPYQLDREFDFMKMDIEGYEEALLALDLKVPAVVELHGLQQIKKFQDKGYFIVGNEYRYDCVSFAYWKCKQ